MDSILGDSGGPNSRILVANTFNGLTRDFIISGPTTTLNSVTNFTPFGSSSNLNLTLTGAVTPIKLVIAGKLVTISSALTVALTDTNWNFVYFDKDTGALGTVTVAPRYWWEAPSHATGQHWFDMNTGLMKLSDGVSTWTAKNRIFLGCWRADTTIDAVYAGDVIGLTVCKRVEQFGDGTDGMIDTNNSNTTVNVKKKYSFVGQRGTSSLVHTAALVLTFPMIRIAGFFMNLGTGGVALNALGSGGGAGGTGAGSAGTAGGYGGAGGGGGASAASAGGAGGGFWNGTRPVLSAGGTAGAAAGGAGGNGSASAQAESIASSSGSPNGPCGSGSGGAGGAGDGSAGGNGGAGGGGIDIQAASVALAVGATFTCNGANGTDGPSATRAAGGGGGGGRSRLRYGNLYDNNGSTFTGTGGTGGASGGANSGAGGNGGAGVFEKLRV